MKGEMKGEVKRRITLNDKFKVISENGGIYRIAGSWNSFGAGFCCLVNLESGIPFLNKSFIFVKNVMDISADELIAIMDGHTERFELIESSPENELVWITREEMKKYDPQRVIELEEKIQMAIKQQEEHIMFNVEKEKLEGWVEIINKIIFPEVEYSINQKEMADRVITKSIQLAKQIKDQLKQYI